MKPLLTWSLLGLAIGACVYAAMSHDGRGRAVDTATAPRDAAVPSAAPAMPTERVICAEATPFPSRAADLLRPDQHAALDRAYRAALAREGLAPLTSHEPAR